MNDKDDVRFYEASVQIAATPDAVWAVLVDGAAYPEWNSGVTAVDGPIVDGATITVHADVNPDRAFPVRVSLDPHRLMRWTGGMPLRLFRGDRRFTLVPTADGGTRFTMREEYSGPLVGLMWPRIPDLASSFVQFTAGVKARVEGR